jgi:ribosomal protein L4
MKKVTQETNAGKAAAQVSGLDELIQHGARQIIHQAIEAELATLLEQYGNDAGASSPAHCVAVPLMPGVAPPGNVLPAPDRLLSHASFTP